MATFTYDQIDIAVGRAETAAETYINVATLQSDFTKGKNYEDIKTLKRRIDDYLEDNILDFSGDDGVSVTAVNLDTENGVVTVDFSDGNQDTFTDLKPEEILSIVNYSIDENKSLVQTYNDSSSNALGRVIGEDGNLLTDASVDENGFIIFTFLNGNTYQIGNVDNFGENPITDAKVENGYLFIEVENEWRSVSDSPVEGPRGEDGVLPAEGSEDKVLMSIDSETGDAVLTIPLNDGTSIVLDNIPTERKVAEKTDALDLEWNEGQDVTFTLPTGERKKLGRFMGEDGEDGEISPTLKDIGGGRKIRDNYTGQVTTDREYERSVFKKENFNVTATNQFPTLRYIDPNVDDVQFGGINTNGDKEEKLYALEGVYEDIISDDVTLDNAYINTEGNLALDLSFSDQEGNPLTSTVDIGSVVGDDGKTVTDIAIQSNGDIEVTYNDGNPASVIGNVAYDEIVEAEIDPLTNTIKLTLDSGLELVTENTNISGSDGIARSVVNVIEENTDDSGNRVDGVLKFEMNKGDSPISVGVVRPLKNHTVNVTDTGQLAIKLDGESTATEYGKITGQDSPEDITDTVFDGNSILLDINGGNSTKNVFGELRRYTLADYLPTQDVLRLTNSDTDTFDVYYLRPEDGADGVWITDFTTYEDPNGNGRLLDINMSDGSKALDGFDLDRPWLENVQFGDNGDLITTYGYETGNVTVAPYNYPDINGEDGVYPTTIRVEDVNFWARDWNDGRDDQDLGQVVARYIEELYVDTNETSSVMLRYSNELEATDQLGVDLRGEMARYVTDLSIDANRDLVVTYNYGDPEVIPRIDGLDARYITDITRDGDTFTLTFSDNSTETVDLLRFDGNNPRWITDFKIDENGQFAVKYTYIDYDGTEVADTEFTPILQGDGLNAEYIVNVTRDGDVFTTVDKDGVETEIGTINSFDGIEGEFVDSISVDADNKLVASWYNDDQPDQVILDNVDFDIEIFLITINQEGNIVVYYSDGTEYVSPVTVRRRMTDAYSEVESDISYIETNYTDNDIEVGYAAGEDKEDGAIVQQIYIDQENDKLLLDLDDDAETTITAGDFVRREIKDIVLSGDLNQNLVVQYNDGTSDNLGNVRGDSNASLNMVDAFINQQYELVLTLNDPSTENDAIVPIALPGVRGDDGIGIASAIINGDGDLVFTLDDADATKINAGNVKIDLGFSSFNPTKVYNTAETMTQNGTIYAAQRDGVTADPQEDPSAWTVIRLADDPTPDASRPDAIAPLNGDEIPFLRPFLQGSGIRNHHSVDSLDYREFEIDLADGNFSNPVYSAQENRTNHQVELDLDPTETYRWRMRDFVSPSGYVTDWTVPQTFSIASETFPEPTVSVINGQDVSAMPMDAAFTSSTYNGTGTHDSSTWQVVDDNTGETIYEVVESTTDKTSFVMPWGYFKTSSPYRARVRYHIGDDVTPFSDWLNFTTKTVFDSIGIKPVVELDGEDTTATVARPAFLVGNIDNFWKYYYDRMGLVATWEVYDNTDTLVWSLDTSIDIPNVRVSQVLASGVTHKVRVKYTGGIGFAGPSEWSDYLSFTPSWDINKPVVSYNGDLAEASATSKFSVEDPSTVVNDSYRYTRWTIEDISGNTLYKANIFDNSDWTVYFGPDDSEQDRRVYAQYVGLYGESERSDPLDITLQSFIATFVYTGSSDNTHRKIFNSKRQWTYGHSSTINYTDADDRGNSYLATTDDRVIKVDKYGNNVWTYTGHGGNVTSIAVNATGDLFSASNDNTIDKINMEDGSFIDNFTGFSNSVRSVAISMGSEYLIGADYNGFVKRIDLDDLTEIWGTQPFSASVEGLNVQQDGTVIASSKGGYVKSLDIQDGTTNWTYGDGSTSFSEIDLDPLKNTFVGDDSGNIHKIDTSGNQIWKKKIHDGTVHGIAADDYGLVYSSGNDGNVCKVDGNGNLIWTYIDHTGSVNSVDVNNEPILLAHVDLRADFEKANPPTPFAPTREAIERSLDKPLVAGIYKNVITDQLLMISAPKNIEAEYDSTLT